MSKVEVNLLGIGAVKLCSEQATIYIDAFSELVKPQHIEKADLILVTHADGDHFEARETARAAGDGALRTSAGWSGSGPFWGDGQLAPSFHSWISSV